MPLRYLMAVLCAAGLPIAQAATLTVTARADTISSNGLCTLREALIATNNNTDFSDCVATDLPYGDDLIVFAPSLAGQVHVLSLAGADENLAHTGDLDILDNLTIRGDPTGTTINADSIDRVLDVPVLGVSLTLQRLRIVQGNAPENGGGASGGGIAMAASGLLTLEDCQVLGNQVSSVAGPASGGGVKSYSSIALVRSEVTENRVTGVGYTVGGGIAIQGAGTQLTLTDSRVALNAVLQDSTAASQGGGGIHAESGTTVLLERSEVADNTVKSTGGSVRGGGISTAFGADLSLINTTISSNSARTEGGQGAASVLGGGVYSGSPALLINNSTIANNIVHAPSGDQLAAGGVIGGGNIANTLVADNTAITSSGSTASDCVNGGFYNSSGYNLIRSNCGISANTGDQFGLNPGLLPLMDNGGSNPITSNPRTHAPATDSPARDAGNPAATSTFPQCEGIDQRGLPRAVGGMDTRCDIGAHEVDAAMVDLIFADGFDT